MSWSFLLTLPLGVYLSLLGFFYIFQERLVYFPHAGNGSTPTDWGLTAHEVALDSEGYRLHGWYIPGEPTQPVVLFSHGNASTVSQLRDYALVFHQLGLGMLLYDYRGYGLSTGKPDEAGTYADGQAAWEHLTGPLGFSPGQVVLYGHSLGGGVATWLASRHPALALVLEGTFTSLPELGQEVYPFLPRWVGRIHYDNRTRLANLTLPTLILHARDDEVIGLTHGQRLYQAAREPKQLLEMAGSHNRGFVHAGPQAWSVLQHFIQTAPKAVVKEAP